MHRPNEALWPLSRSATSRETAKAPLSQSVKDVGLADSAHFQNDVNGTLHFPLTFVSLAPFTHSTYAACSEPQRALIARTVWTLRMSVSNEVKFPAVSQNAMLPVYVCTYTAVAHSSSATRELVHSSFCRSLRANESGACQPIDSHVYCSVAMRLLRTSSSPAVLDAFTQWTYSSYGDLHERMRSSCVSSIRFGSDCFASLSIMLFVLFVLLSRGPCCLL